MKAVLTAPPSWDVGTLLGQGLVKHTVLVDVIFQRLLDCAKEQRAKQVADELLSVSRVRIVDFLAGKLPFVTTDAAYMMCDEFVCMQESSRVYVACTVSVCCILDRNSLAIEAAA